MPRLKIRMVFKKAVYLTLSIFFLTALLSYSFVTHKENTLLVSVELVLINIAGIFLLLFIKKLSSAHPKIQQADQKLSVSDNEQEKLRYEALLASIGQGLVVIDKHGRITTFNKAAESMLGWTAEEVMGKTLNKVIKVEYKSNETAIKSKFGSQQTLYFIRKNKTKFPVAITATSYVQGTHVLGNITLFRDITTEQNIDSMKNEFISLASHQLRTPLSAIKWYAYILLQGKAGQLLPEQLKYASNIYSSTERIIDLVNTLLNISRIESGRIIVEPKITDIKKLVEEILVEVRVRSEEKKQKVTLTIENNFPLISLDPTLIRQVYLDLLTNAVNYTPEEGEISINITKNDTDMISEIHDNGYGIPESEQGRLYDKFYRGSNIIDRSSTGTGLGLYFIKTIIELCQGKIWYKSKEGKGTSFWFSLPLSGTLPKKGVVTLDS
jgi:PAS domain S-box-containing protein